MKITITVLACKVYLYVIDIYNTDTPQGFAAYGHFLAFSFSMRISTVFG